MKKGTIILEKKDRIKTITLLNIILKEESPSVVFINSNYPVDSNYFFSGCEKQTKVIIIDGIVKASYLECFYNYISDGINVNKKNKPVFHINPKIVIICNHIKKCDLPKGLSFTSRFDIL